ncbi:MAG TPA: MGMT family protein [Blastocatellia bacterium]|nr:MGMT family protein [Blastocatellia bacterium]
MSKRQNRIVSEKGIQGRPQDAPAYRELVYQLVIRIPAGRVMSYGSVARVLGPGYDARAIGNVMHATPEDGRSIPWHRVINAQGGCSTAGLTVPPDLQQRLLEAEGIVFNEKGRCQIEKYLWVPPEYLEEEGREDANQARLFE